MAFDARRALREIPGHLRPVIREGDTNWFVRLLRKSLFQAEGFSGIVFPPARDDLNGNFNERLTECVLIYQDQHGLTVDGIVGPQTWAALASEKTHDVRLAQEGDQKAEQIRQSIVAVARFAEQMAIRERGGNNRGPMVEALQDFAKGHPGDPWCLIFAFGCAIWGPAIEDAKSEAAHSWKQFWDNVRSEAADRVDEIDMPSLSCSALHRWAKTEVRLRTNLPAPGDLWVLRGGPTGWKHVGVVVAVDAGAYDTEVLTTVEGNTGAQPGAEDADGDGVYLRTRSLRSGVAVDVA